MRLTTSYHYHVNYNWIWTEYIWFNPIIVMTMTTIKVLRSDNHGDAAIVTDWRKKFNPEMWQFLQNKWLYAFTLKLERTKNRRCGHETQHCSWNISRSGDTQSRWRMFGFLMFDTIEEYCASVGQYCEKQHSERHNLFTTTVMINQFRNHHLLFCHQNW